ncbi:hypothetical protein IAG44_23215 [Streptomyces roseirectus]|uniref:Uncharacterized protein n=1 Tax=Streptomyces roseirectus TaxID=2768066 RepID=A0A7H0IGX1_9ACTN|nr:hypothetical protein [Streptomyces roseirectus]QNP72037.1 hypothetical protein IAG44_23215 [Streptomyces roseirectus]
MAQSGQGEEPSARPAREGIVLPSDGGEPLLPGMTGASAVPPAPRYAPQPDPSPAPGQGWSQPDPQPAQPTTQSWPLPPEGGDSPVTYGQGTPYDQGATGRQSAPAPYDPRATDGQPASAPYDQGATYGQPAPYQQTYDQPAPGASYGQSAPLPPMDEAATQYIPPVRDGGYPNSGGFPGSPGDFPGSEGATQYLPPVPAVEEGATQVLPPITPGALPPESGPAPYPAGDSAPTQVIPPIPADGRPPAGFENLFRDAPAPTPGGQSGPGGPGIPPQQPAYGQQQPPYGQQQPPYAAQQPQQPPYGRQPQPGPAQAPYAPQGARQAPYDGPDDGRGRGGRTRSKVPLIIAAGVAIAAVGIGAGALMGSGGDDKDANSTNVAVSQDASQGAGAAAGDGAEAQAQALDKLLADSGSSRATVIGAVADVKACNDLEKAAADLRDAANQRNALVTKLSALSVDKLPDHTALTDALTKAWQASAAADDHYAAWADQVAGDKKNCRKGQARTTSETAQGNRESGTATQQKGKAAALWNVIAKKYGLTERQPTQL